MQRWQWWRTGSLAKKVSKSAWDKSKEHKPDVGAEPAIQLPETSHFILLGFCIILHPIYKVRDASSPWASAKPPLLRPCLTPQKMEQPVSHYELLAFSEPSLSSPHPQISLPSPSRGQPSLPPSPLGLDALDPSSQRNPWEGSLLRRRLSHLLHRLKVQIGVSEG